MKWWLYVLIAFAVLHTVVTYIEALEVVQKRHEDIVRRKYNPVMIENIGFYTGAVLAPVLYPTITIIRKVLDLVLTAAGGRRK